MKQYMILLNVDEEVLADKTVEGELGWLKESGIAAQSIVEINDKGYMIDLPSQRMLPEENLVVEVGGDIDYPRISVMRDLGKGSYEELVRVEKNADEGIRSVTYIDQDGLEESETEITQIYFADPIEIFFNHFDMNSHSMSSQTLSYDEDEKEFSFKSSEPYGATTFLQIADKSRKFEFRLYGDIQESIIIPEMAAYFKSLDYNVELFMKHASEKFNKKEVSSDGAV